MPEDVTPVSTPPPAEHEGEPEALPPRTGSVVERAAPAHGGEDEPREGEGWRPLHPGWLAAERFTGRLGWAALLLGVGVVLGLALDRTPWLLLLVPSGLVVWWVLVKLSIGYDRRAYEATAFRLTEDVLMIRRGVWWKKTIHVPRSRIQHTDVTQGPVARRFGIASLVVHTAGTQDSTVELAGIAPEEARALRDRLLPTQADHDGV